MLSSSVPVCTSGGAAKHGCVPVLSRRSLVVAAGTEKSKPVSTGTMRTGSGTRPTGTQRTTGSGTRPTGTQRTTGTMPTTKKTPVAETVNYGTDWYEKTRQLGLGNGKRTISQEIEYKRQANLIANNGKERKDLYTDNWDGGEYKGSSVNILTVLIVISILTPVAGIIFAFQTYGVLWG